MDQGKTVSKSFLPVKDLQVKLTQVKGGEGEYNIAYFFGNDDGSDFVIHRKFLSRYVKYLHFIRFRVIAQCGCRYSEKYSEIRFKIG